MTLSSNAAFIVDMMDNVLNISNLKYEKFKQIFIKTIILNSMHQLFLILFNASIWLYSSLIYTLMEKEKQH